MRITDAIKITEIIDFPKCIKFIRADVCSTLIVLDAELCPLPSGTVGGRSDAMKPLEATRCIEAETLLIFSVQRP